METRVALVLLLLTLLVLLLWRLIHWHDKAIAAKLAAFDTRLANQEKRISHLEAAT